MEGGCGPEYLVVDIEGKLKADLLGCVLRVLAVVLYAIGRVIVMVIAAADVYLAVRSFARRVFWLVL